MIIYTNKGNPLALKLLICAKLAKKDVVVKNVSLNDNEVKDLKHLPILQLDSGVQIFSTDAAVKYLLPNEMEVALISDWLEWSTTRLAPALTHNMAVGHRADPNAKPILTALVKTLDDTLAKKSFLTGDSPCAADFAIWSLLALEGTLKGAVNIDNLQRWNSAIQEIPEVIEALKEMPLKDLQFATLQQSNKYGGLHHIVLDKELASTPEAKSQVLMDSPTHITDTVQDEEVAQAKAAFISANLSRGPEPKTVLPKPGQRNNLITSALPYVNNVPHLGNIIGCVLSADIFARYSRTCGYNTLYVCGTDEYGTATETKALAENLTPKEICDKYFDIHNAIYCWFGIGFDYFGRTTTQEQTEIVQNMFLDLYNGGFIETQSVEQLLCQKCDRFLADRFVEGTCPHPGCGYEDARGDQCDACGKLINAIELLRPRCKVCSTSPVVRESKQFFLDLPKIEPKLRDWLETVDGGWTHNARVITKSWIREGLKSRCITRDLKWGIPVPLDGYRDKVFYVWFDAPIGYISITSRYTKEWRQWWQPEASANTKINLYQFMAKDNVPFHSVMFPCTLLGIGKGHTLVNHIMATEYLNYEDGKFSKSRGVGVFGNDAQDTGIPADVWRFYLASARPEGQDSCFSWNDLAARNNSELLKNLGNFVNRALVFCEKFFDSTIPAMNLNEDDYVQIALINRELKGYIQQMEKAKLRDGIRHLLSISRYGNGIMQAEEPWVKVKGTDDDKARAGTVVALCCNMACLLATLIFPFMPSTARNLYNQLNVKDGYLNPDKPHMQILLPSGHKIGKPAVLFNKIEQTRIDELKKKYAGMQQMKPVVPTETKKATDLPNLTVADAEKAISEQGEKVRKLKSEGADRTIWQPEVAILLDLKKQLAALQKDAPKYQSDGKNNTETIANLEQEITKQGKKVRTLKASAEKSVWEPEVKLLLSLKAKLNEITGKIEPLPTKGKKKK